MNKVIRIIVVVAVLGLVALVSSQVVQASRAPGPNTSNATQKDVQLPASDTAQVSEPGDTQPLSNGYKGTIRPPGCEEIVLKDSGEYSVCGVAIVSVDFKDDDVQVILNLDALPADAGNVLAGTIDLQCLVDGELHKGPHDEHAEPRICFAAPPDKEVQVKFYDESAKSWVQVETTIADGRACAPANNSGKYVLVEN